MRSRSCGYRQGILRPSPLWALVVSGATLVGVVLLMSTTVFAVAPIARSLVALGVDRIVLDRGSCFGSCPAYRLTIRADGRASFTGVHFVRLRGTYETQFNPARFGRLADVLYRRGMFATRLAPTIVDAPATTISVIYSSGAVDESRTYGLVDDDLDEDISASALYIDGFAGHLCDWQRTEMPDSANSQPGWYSPIIVAPCHR
jgi:hypothetical protein